MTRINRQIRGKKFTTTPRKITPKIEEICAEINANERPVFVPVKPDPDARESECFHNVSQKVERDGGSMLYGWNLWEWSRVFVEAEHHAVWVKEGKLIDVTPKKDLEQRILFLPDQSKAYDFDSQKRLINIKRSLGRYPSVQNWIDVSDAWQNACEQSRVGNQVFYSQLQEKFYEAMKNNAMNSVILELAADTKPRERCICASGKEFRKCCSRLVRS